MATYTETLNSVEGMSLMSNYAVQTALLQQKFREMGDLPPSESLIEAGQRLSALEDVIAVECDGLPVEVAEELQSIRSLIKLVSTAQVAERQARELMLEQAKIVQAETQRVERSGKYVTVEQIMALMAAIVTYHNQIITDENLQRYSAQDVRNLLGSKLLGLSNRGSGPGSEPRATG